MKRKLVLILCFSGALTLSIDFMKDKDLQSTKVSAQSEKVFLGKADTNKGDTLRVITREEQDARENMLNLEDMDYTTVITKEEQDMVENMSAEEGFVPQKEGTGFFFIKEK
ncbi:hypothetical protein U2I54_27140 [Bacillus pseudomycoides]|uniref:Uncharacterized protein n=1 Tax=Bacillus bingmayongensis TaxID=1150157 RepID=A0ABU5K4K0_9BACI|nr:hypothetical protein [Bacillus pseudomycoides]